MAEYHYLETNNNLTPAGVGWGKDRRILRGSNNFQQGTDGESVLTNRVKGGGETVENLLKPINCQRRDRNNIKYRA